ncbi:uncharacterized protein LOC125829589 [Solanum verrucosum]|uniref:uncharacterized protein LOC125829589 n=1 Tax=Solanum verrucosum TaxID=315347 RepID=UPI0020D19779|nr:uncharacterized protein LOC125829589 [Solanum verrucosum]
MEYPTWLANVVPVPKKDENVKVCVDYRDLKKASPKDNFPLPNIHILIDNCAKHETQSFVDCFVGYHQIEMHKDDAEKTAFITPWGVYNYKVMPFGLKNVGATYMRAMTTLFHDMIHKEIEVYMDNVIIKSKKGSNHLNDLRKFFARLRKYNLKLNPEKCVFGVPVGKLLGFIVSRRGIELDPSKIKAISDLPPLNSKKETDECQQAFDKIKDYLSNPPVLVPPKSGRPLLLYILVLDNAFSCILGQHDMTGKKEQAIYYMSKKFTSYEARYSLLERTYCAILLSEFDIVYVTQKEVKAQTLADHMAENPIDDDYRPLKTYFPDEEVAFEGEDISEEYDGWRMFFDRAKKLSGSDIGVVLISPTRQHYPVRGEWATKNRKLLPYLECVHRLCKRFIKAEFKHMLRIQNEFADALATLSSVIQHPDHNYIDPIYIHIYEQPSYCFHVEEGPDGKPWYNDIRGYLKSGEYTEDATSVQKRTIRRLVNQFFLSGEILYRRTPDLGLLRCVEAGEASGPIEEIYAGTCGPDMNGFTLAKKILRSGYFWLTMETDCIHYVKKCHQCQTHVDMIRVPPNEIYVTSSPWLFAAWGMDVIGPIEPATFNVHRFILVAIDYFTKWVEATSHKSVTKKVVDDFVKNNIICRFGIPESIITDNGTNINSDLMRSLCEKFKISHRNSTIYRPQMNEVVEAPNKNIKRILRKIVDNHRHWHEKLSFALLGYRTTIRTSTGATPYFLVYGNEAVIPAEVEIPSLRIIQEAELSDAKWIQVRAENLTLIDGRRISAISHGQLYQ